MTKEAQTHHNSIANHIAHTFGGEVEIGTQEGPSGRSIDILRAVDRPQPGLCCYSTIGLSDHPIAIDGREDHVELVAVAPSDQPAMAGVLIEAAFRIIIDRWVARPGVIFESLITRSGVTSTLDHILFTPPFLWEGALDVLEFDTLEVAWLQLVPISDAECKVAVEQGPDQLDALLAESQIDVSDLQRPSVV